MAVNFSDTSPAAPAGKVNVHWQQASGSASAYVDLSGSGGGLPAVIGVTIDGGGSVITIGQHGYISIPFACTITGWDIVADQSGSITIEVDKHNAAPPNTTTDKISGTSPIALSSAQLAQNGSITGWTTSVVNNDVIGFNVASASTVTRVTATIRTTRL